MLALMLSGAVATGSPPGDSSLPDLVAASSPAVSAAAAAATPHANAPDPSVVPPVPGTGRVLPEDPEVCGFLLAPPPPRAASTVFG